VKIRMQQGDFWWMLCETTKK